MRGNRALPDPASDPPFPPFNVWAGWKAERKTAG